MRTVQGRGFGFVQRLAKELSLGDVRLPSLPDVVVRVKEELAEEDFDVARLARVIATEPVLAGRVMAMANSAAFLRGGAAATDLPTAITRIGGAAVRTAALSFAVAQLREAQALEPGLAERLKRQWARGTEAAAVAYVLGRRTRRVSADEAMLAGLLHSIGAIYIISRAGEHPELFEDSAEAEALIQRWHPSVGRAIIESWSLPPEVAEAVGGQHERDEYDRDQVTLGDALVMTLVLTQISDPPTPDELAAAASLPAARRLGLTGAGLVEIRAEGAAEAQQLTAALRA